jgi:transcriptional regulator with XRE-family HTH domain
LPVGQRLKALRTNRNITIREVESASLRIAEAKRDKRFSISNGWLAQLEKGVSEPGICKLFSLSVIYRVKFIDLIQLYDVDIDEIEKYEPVANVLGAKTPVTRRRRQTDNVRGVMELLGLEERRSGRPISRSTQRLARFASRRELEQTEIAIVFRLKKSAAEFPYLRSPFQVTVARCDRICAN